jgi:hypothetical protein
LHLNSQILIPYSNGGGADSALTLQRSHQKIPLGYISGRDILNIKTKIEEEEETEYR